jgi:hypothetical protein
MVNNCKKSSLKECEIMLDGLVQFEAEIASPGNIRSRVIWPDSEGPWIDGGMEDLMVHFTYASWTAYNLGCALSMALSSKDDGLGRSVSEMMTRMISSMGAIQLAEIHLTPEAMEDLRRSRLEP